MQDQLPTFKKILAEIHRKEGERLAEQSKKVAEKYLSLTFSDAHVGFKGATVANTRQVIKRDNGCIVKMHFFVAGKSGKPHKVWHIVNKGRATGPLKSNIRFHPRHGTRTTPGSLALRPFQGEDTVEFRSKGYIMKGFEGRHFYDTAINKIIFDLFAGGRFNVWEVKDKGVKDG